ncbi:alpha/beta fold hydrolase [Kribbella sp. CA-247076]|uniref:alpha/beta fold hydrolase n=1 Tax=Kribbella sp. CA-247076 TaxID=3239941 RepID=UPI003D91DCEB
MNINGFDYRRVPGVDGISLNVAVAGSGPPIVLLHGFPQTHLMWRHVATDLAADHTVICPDLRGYGASDKPTADGGHDASDKPTADDGYAANDKPADDANGTTTGTYAKRTMAADVVAVARALGHEKFALVGHDRGALVAFRAGLDHPDVITHLMCLDVLPTLDMWDVMHGTSAAVGFHLYLMAQPPGLAETMIAAAADTFFGHFLTLWANDDVAIPADVRAAYLDACRDAVPSIVADYRASATIDVAHDREDLAAGNKLTMPVSVIQQDWGAALGFDAAALWRAWAKDLDHRTTSAGHFMAEESPAEITAAIRALLTRARQ